MNHIIDGGRLDFPRARRSLLFDEQSMSIARNTGTVCSIAGCSRRPCFCHELSDDTTLPTYCTEHAPDTFVYVGFIGLDFPSRGQQQNDADTAPPTVAQN